MKFDRSRMVVEVGSHRRKLRTKPLIALIAILLVCNILWIIAWLKPNGSKQAEETVATVAGEPITREQWMAEMESELGRSTLLGLVNDKVMEAAAEKYGIEISDKEIELELALIQSIDDRAYSGMAYEKAQQKIRSNLILEKVLTKDVVIQDEAIESYYKENAALYNISTAYRTAILVVPTKDEAEQALDELSHGSSFEVLAKERSINLASASLGGDIGYINKATQTVDKEIFEAATRTKSGTNSGIIALQDGTFAIILVRDVLKGQSFKLNEVKDHIKRELALEQLPQSVNPEAFWKEFDAKWFYGK
jgi:foldase protein PrsA